MMHSSIPSPEFEQGVHEKLKHRLLLVGVLFVGFLVRLFGIVHDLPYTYFGDEEQFIRRSVAFGSGDLNPHWFHKPGFYMYWLFAEFGVYFLIGKLVGWFGSVDDFARHFFMSMEPFLLIGRMTTVLFSVATIYLTYRLGKRYLNQRVGLLAAWFLATCVGNFSSAIVVKADVPSTFFAMLSLFFVFSLYDKQRMRDYVWAGLFAGIGTATKYYPITMLVPIYFAHILSGRKQNIPFRSLVFHSKMVASVVACVAGFFLCSPYNFLDPTWITQKGTFILNLHKVAVVDRHAGFVSEQSVGFVDKMLSILVSLQNMGGVLIDRTGMGLLVGVLALFGMLLFLTSGNRKGWICLSFVGGFALIASVYNPSYASSRHLSMIYPVLCIAAGGAMEFGISRMTPMFQTQVWKNATVVLLGFLFILPSAFWIIRYDVRVLEKDTRLVAKEWIEQHIPQETKILLEENGPRLQWSRKRLEKIYQLAKKEATVGPFTTHLVRAYRHRLEVAQDPAYDITEIHHPWWLVEEAGEGVRRLETEKDRDMGNPLKLRGVMPFEYYQQQGFEYIVTHNKAYRRYFERDGQKNFPSINRFYQDLFQKGELIKEFNPDSWWRSGPIVRIYRVRNP